MLGGSRYPIRKFELLMFAPSARTGRLPRFFCRAGKAWMLTFYPRHKFLDGWVLKECVNRRELLRKLRIRENRMYLIVANTMQANSFLAALALRNEKILFFLIIRDHALAQRANHWLWFHVR